MGWIEVTDEISKKKNRYVITAMNECGDSFSRIVLCGLCYSAVDIWSAGFDGWEG